MEFKTGVEVGKDVTLDQLRSEGTRRSISASAQASARLSAAKGDELSGVFTGIDFLRDVNLGKAPESASLSPLSAAATLR